MYTSLYGVPTVAQHGLSCTLMYTTLTRDALSSDGTFATQTCQRRLFADNKQFLSLRRHHPVGLSHFVHLSDVVQLFTSH